MGIIYKRQALRSAQQDQPAPSWLQGPPGAQGEQGPQGPMGPPSTWVDLQGKPATFPPSEHGHAAISSQGEGQEHAEVVTAAGVQVSALLRKASGVFSGLQLAYDAVAGYCKATFTGKKRGSVGLYDYPGALLPGPTIAPNIVDRSENALGVDPFLTASNLDTVFSHASFLATPTRQGLMSAADKEKLDSGTGGGGGGIVTRALCSMNFYPGSALQRLHITEARTWVRATKDADVLAAYYRILPNAAYTQMAFDAQGVAQIGAVLGAGQVLELKVDVRPGAALAAIGLVHDLQSSTSNKVITSVNFYQGLPLHRIALTERRTLSAFTLDADVQAASYRILPATAYVPIVHGQVLGIALQSGQVLEVKATTSAALCSVGVLFDM